jgi:hypothetical protein
MTSFFVQQPKAPGPINGPNAGAYALPGADDLRRRIDALSGTPPITTDGSAYGAAVPDQLKALALMHGIVNGTSPSAAAAQQSIGQDQASAQGIDPRDLAHALLHHAGGLQAVTQQAAGARAGETQQGADMFNNYQPTVSGQALKEFALQSGMGHINNQVHTQNQALRTALDSLVGRGTNQLNSDTQSYASGNAVTQLDANATGFNNAMGDFRAGAAGLSGGSAALANYLHSNAPSSVAPSSSQYIDSSGRVQQGGGNYMDTTNPALGGGEGAYGGATPVTDTTYGNAMVDSSVA